MQDVPRGGLSIIYPMNRCRSRKKPRQLHRRSRRRTSDFPITPICHKAWNNALSTTALYLNSRQNKPKDIQVRHNCTVCSRNIRRLKLCYSRRQLQFHNACDVRLHHRWSLGILAIKRVHNLGLIRWWVPVLFNTSFLGIIVLGIVPGAKGGNQFRSQPR